MSAAGEDRELVSLRRSFRIGMVAVAAFLIAVGGLVAAFGSNADRPAGIAERWLVALSDTTRDGLADDALERLEEHEGREPGLTVEDRLLAFPALQDDHGAGDDGEARFETVRVGRAVTAGLDEGVALVPVEVTPYEADAVDGYVFMSDTDDGWKVGGFASPEATEELGAFEPGGLCPDDRCPGFPLERPERAPLGFWLGTLALGALIAVGCTLAARAATPKGPTRDAVSGAAS